MDLNNNSSSGSFLQQHQRLLWIILILLLFVFLVWLLPLRDGLAPVDSYKISTEELQTLGLVEEGGGGSSLKISAEDLRELGL